MDASIDDFEASIFLEAMNTRLQFKSDVIESVFSASLRINETQGEKHDLVNSYHTNSYNYRSPEFKKGTDLLIVGCSYTYGIGLPYETVWGTQLANMHKLSYANISMPGASVPWMVDQVFRYFNDFGHPKYLTMLIPNFHRGIAYLDQEINTGTKHPRKGDYSDERVSAASSFSPTSLAAKDFPKISKRPHDAAEVTPPQLSIYSSFRHIRYLESYCSSNGINFKWSVFEAPSEEFANAVDQKFPLLGKLDLYRRNWREEFSEERNGFFHRNMEDGSVIHCCEELRSWAGDAFDLATDRDNGIDRAHPGVHSHIHAARDFSRALFSEG